MQKTAGEEGREREREKRRRRRETDGSNQREETIREMGGAEREQERGMEMEVGEERGVFFLKRQD